jgi:type I restriction-modification system DNA methylase subunit
MRESNILYLVISKFCDVDLHPNTVPNAQMGLIFENLIRRFNELANETAGDHFTPREVIRLMVNTASSVRSFRIRIRTWSDSTFSCGIWLLSCRAERAA